MIKTLAYSGLLCIHDYGEAYGLLFLSSLQQPLADVLNEEIYGKMVTVRYWITNRQSTKEEAKADFIEQISGKAETDFGSHYSDYTGYLWTDEECKIGGHDLISELKSNAGKWIILEIDVH